MNAEMTSPSFMNTKANSPRPKRLQTNHCVAGKNRWPDGDATVTAAEPLIQLYFRQGRYQDAEPLVSHQLAGVEKRQGGLACCRCCGTGDHLHQARRAAELEGVYKPATCSYEKMSAQPQAMIKRSPAMQNCSEN